MIKTFGQPLFIAKPFSLSALAALAGSICFDGKN
jgi:hypothetical protein